MMITMRSVFWWRKPEYPEETTDLRQVADDTLRGCSSRGGTAPPRSGSWLLGFLLCLIGKVGGWMGGESSPGGPSYTNQVDQNQLVSTRCCGLVVAGLSHR